MFFDKTNPKSFANLGYEDFRRLAADPSLSRYERIGFPDSYRADYEAYIFEDIRAKVTLLDHSRQRVLDIGPGCSDLPKMLIAHCRERDHNLTLVDSHEMLALLPDEDFITKYPALFPACEEFLAMNREKLDVILCYSVLHYAIKDTAIFRFFDSALSLLAPGGQFLIGDIPNISKRKRFFSSEAGARFHQSFMQTNEAPLVEFNRIEYDQIDDAIVLGLMMRARSQGFDAYVMPQDTRLPMANRREDLLIIRP